MNENDRLAEICYQSLAKKRLDSELYKKRLEEELAGIAEKRDAGYFLGLVENKKRFNTNDHNLAVVYLLGLAPSVAWNRGPGYTVPEWP